MMPKPAAPVARLASLETTIEEGLESFLAVGTALAEIRDRNLYKVAFSSFGKYCTERWGVSRSHAYRLCDSAQTAVRLASEGVPVTRYGYALLLSKLDPADQRTAWVSAQSGRSGPTEELVRQAVNRTLRSAGSGSAVPGRQVLNLTSKEVGVLDAVVARAAGGGGPGVSPTNPTLVTLRRKTLALKNKLTGSS